MRLWDSRSAYHPLTRAYLDRLVAGPLAEDKSAAVRADATIPPDVREAALRAIESAGDNPWTLNGDAWQIASAPDAAKADLAGAVRAATRAASMVPWAPALANTLGAAQYRAGAYRDAVVTLERAATLSQAPRPVGLAFLAMAYLRSGDTVSTRKALDRLRERMKDPAYADDAKLQGFLREAEAVVGRGKSVG